MQVNTQPAMHDDWRRGDSLSTPSNYAKPQKLSANLIAKGGLRHPSSFPDTNKKKRNEAADFFAQEKLLIEYWVSICECKEIDDVKYSYV